MCACLLKRFLPFTLTLFVGLMLGSLQSFWLRFDPPDSGNFPASYSSSRTSRAVSLGPTHSRTWLVIKDVPAPQYTEEEARANGAMSALRLRARLDVDGNVSYVETRRPPSVEFADDTMRAAMDIKFIPATEDGKPIPLWVEVEYRCSGDYVGHRNVFQCDARIVEVEKNWRIVYE